MDRPYPPASLLELSERSDFGIRLTPTPEVWEWLQVEILADTGSIHNETTLTYWMQTSESCGCVELREAGPHSPGSGRAGGIAA